MIVSDIRSFECEITQKELIESSEERFLSQMRVVVEETAKRMGRKHILAASDYMFYNTKTENVHAMAKAVRDFNGD